MVRPSTGDGQRLDTSKDSTTRAGSLSTNPDHATGAVTPTTAVQAAAFQGSPPVTGSTPRSLKKRRKVNHACVYCRRSHMTCDDERPCTRCVKRNIGHLCHDEVRPESGNRKSKSDPHDQEFDSPSSPGKGDDQENTEMTDAANQLSSSSQKSSAADQRTGGTFVPPILPLSRSLPPSQVIAPLLVTPGPSTTAPLPDWDYAVGPPNSASYNHYHHPFMFSNSEVSSEFNLMNDFLFNSMMENGMDDAPYNSNDSSVYLPNMMQPTGTEVVASAVSGAEGTVTLATQSIGRGIPARSSTPLLRPASTMPNERAKENYYLTAADPSGSNQLPEERMKLVLKAKMDAGMLKPFNYVKGYARLQKYMEQNMVASSRQRIIKQLDKFRPKFRERTQRLTDMDLVVVEEWFERSLMEYDRVLASMAVPACLWRRTGEIFRGNKEFAELIKVPIEQMRDGKLAIYELVDEESAVSYWEKFGTIAFDTNQKAMLTSCHLKHPDPSATETTIHCCFSFTIRRDSYNIPSLIIGNFLPIND